jgi:hypothetical protein
VFGYPVKEEVEQNKLFIQGGPGSGDFNHKGRPGEVGGSQKETSRKDYTGGKTPPKILADIKSTWQGDRRDVAVGTIISRSKNDITIVKDGDEVIGVLGIRPPRVSFVPEGIPKGNYVYIDGIATKRSGYGEQVMQIAIEKAKASNSGIFLTSNNDITGFYEKIGMTRLEKNSRTFYWTPKQVQGMKTNSSKLFLLGGPGSGYHDHPGRPGEVGGSSKEDYFYDEDPDFPLVEKYSYKWLSASDYEAKQIAYDLIKRNGKLHSAYLDSVFGEDYPESVKVYRVGGQQEGIVSVWSNKASAESYQKRFDVDRIYEYTVKTKDLVPSSHGTKELWIQDYQLG